MAAAVMTGDAPVKNWGGIGECDFPTAYKISDDNVIKYDVASYGCFGCPVACGGLQRIASGPYVVESHKPEYETLAAFGSMCLNDNVESIIYLNHLCNEFGLDTISAGSTIAFAMECYENGLLTQEETDGIALDWGNHSAIVEMTLKIARREGLGDILADGVRVAAHKIGKNSHRYAMHVHGQELPMHDPKFIISPFHERRARMYLADATPGRHTQNPHDGYAMQATGICSFIGWLGTEDTMPTLSEFISAVTGWTQRQEDLYLIGNRIATMRQAFNAREGLTPRDFTLPDRVRGNPPFTSGPLAGITLSPQKQVQDYFNIMGWDYHTGKPSNNTLRELQLLDLMLES
jgi:aldehyde:ferredoxin oxidoreductase